MLRLVRRCIGGASWLTALGVILTAAAAHDAGAQTFTVRVQGGQPGYGRGTVTSSPAGINCTFVGTEQELNGTGTCTSSFPAGSTVVLSVATKDGTTHGGWSGDCAAFTSDCTLVVDQNRTTTVRLNPELINVKVALSGNGVGNVVETGIFPPPRLGCAISKGQIIGNCEANYPRGSRVILEFRTPIISGTRFGGFNIPPCVDAFTCRAVVTEPITITGTFTTPEIHVSGAGTGTGRIVGGGTSGIDCTVTPSGTTGSCRRVFDDATPFPVSFTATPSEGSVFVGWSGLCSGTGPCSTLGDLPPNGELVARFDAQPAGTVSLFLNSNGGFGRARVTSSPAGIDCDFSEQTTTAGTGTCRGDFPASSTVQLTAVARDGTKVLGFVGDCESTSPTCTLVMHHDRRVTVQLDPARFPVTIVGAGNGSGTVNGLNTDADPRIKCTVTRGVAGAGCSALYPFGSTVVLGGGMFGSSKFGGYSMPPCVALSCMANVTGPLTITATFTAPAIDITGAGTGSGRVVDAGAGGLDCTVSPAGNSGTCSRNSDVSPATPITFITAPSAGSVFVGWSGLCSGAGACTTSGDFPPNTQLVARFDLTSSTARTLTVTGAGNGSGTVQSSPTGLTCNVVNGTSGGGCAALFAQGANVTLTPTASAGSQFVGWEGDCSGNASCSVTMSEARSVTARFQQVQGAIVLTVMGGGTGNGIVTVSPTGVQCVISGGGVVAGAGCSITFDQPTDVTLTADPQFGSTFGGWEGAGGCTNAQLTCSFSLTSSRTVTVNFVSPHSPHDLTLALTGRLTLTADERAQLDRFGNNNGRFDLGDVLAYLDRTRQKLTSTDAASVTSNPKPTTTRAPTTQRVP